MKGAANLRPFSDTSASNRTRVRRPKGSKRHHVIADVELAARIDAMLKLTKLKGARPACDALVSAGFAQLVSHGDGRFSLRTHGLAKQPAKKDRRGSVLWEMAERERVAKLLARTARLQPTEKTLTMLRALLLRESAGKRRPPVGEAVENLRNRYQKVQAAIGEGSPMRRAYQWLLDVYLEPMPPAAFTFIELDGASARVSVVCDHDSLLVSRWWSAPE